MDNEIQPERIVVIGTSAGGPIALKELVAQLPAELPIAVFIVQHLSPDSPQVLADILSRAGPFPATFARDGESIRAGRILIAPPDHHLLVKPGYVRVLRGPRENRSRPAIDPLFRSAAVAYGWRTIGILLTGLLDDGTAGLLAIERCGGVTVVQEPSEAAHPEMVRSALAQIKVDHQLPVKEMGRLLNDLSHETNHDETPVPEDLRLEQALSERAMSSLDVLDRIAEPSMLSCPSCSGRLWEMDGDEMIRYRCEVGHAYSAQAFLDGQSEAIEGSLWVALRTLEERARMLEKLAIQEEERGGRSAADFNERAAETKVHVRRLRNFLLEWTEPTLSEV